MKKKVCIMTLNGNLNYGNRLQHFALNRLLQNAGLDTVSWIDLQIKEAVPPNDPALFRLLRKALPFSLFQSVRRVYRRWKERRVIPHASRRYRALDRFTRENIPGLERAYARTYEEMREHIRREGIDFFIAGSDQVWYPGIFHVSPTFLRFCAPEQRLSFAASIGVDEIPSSIRAEYAAFLNGMRYISVREQRAVEIVKELTGRDAELTPDPTLLLPKEEWDRAVDTVRMALPERFIACYFLGETPKAVYDFAKRKGLPLIELNRRSEKKWYSADPLQFLYILRAARYVLTDSFHGAAFSLKFEKEFYVFRRSDGTRMFSRIETLAAMFGLWDRVQECDTVHEAPPISAEKRQSIRDELERRREEAMRKLLNAMEIERP